MPRHTLLSLALAATLGTGALHAQSRVHPGDGALSSPESVRATSATATVPIMTLAWTSIQIPARLLEAAASGPSPSRRSGQFILTWQEPTAGPPATTNLAIEHRACTVMRLVMVPCE